MLYFGLSLNVITLFIESIGVILFGNELALFCEKKIIGMYHVRKKL